MGKWIKVVDHTSDIIPKGDCEVWVTRMDAFGEVWVQTIKYYKESERFDYDGIVAWMPYQENKPHPYDCSNYFAGKPRKFKIVEC